LRAESRRNLPGAGGAVNHPDCMNPIVVPANAGTHNPGRQRTSQPLNQQIAEISPFKIVALDQFDLPITLPAL
jgi:hypothetical protein